MSRKSFKTFEAKVPTGERVDSGNPTSMKVAVKNPKPVYYVLTSGRHSYAIVGTAVVKGKERKIHQIVSEAVAKEYGDPQKKPTKPKDKPSKSDAKKKSSKKKLAKKEEESESEEEMESEPEAPKKKPVKKKATKKKSSGKGKK